VGDTVVKPDAHPLSIAIDARTNIAFLICFINTPLIVTSQNRRAYSNIQHSRTSLSRLDTHAPENQGHAISAAT